MSFIGIDLDAIDALDDAALMAGISPGDMVRGTLRMWRHCFRAQTAYVTADRLASFYPGDTSKVAQALVSTEFLDRPSTRPDFHVRGAEKRLGIRQAQSEAGKKNVRNLKQFSKTPPASSGLPPASSEKPPALPGEEPVGDSEGEPGPTSGSAPALTPNTQHPTPNTKRLGADAPPPQELFPRMPKQEKPPPSELKALESRMIAEYESERGVKYVHRKAADTEALKKLRNDATDDTILLVWMTSIASSDKWLRVNSIAQLPGKFNDLVDHLKNGGAKRVGL